MWRSVVTLSLVALVLAAGCGDSGPAGLGNDIRLTETPTPFPAGVPTFTPTPTNLSTATGFLYDEECQVGCCPAVGDVHTATLRTDDTGSVQFGGTIVHSIHPSARHVRWTANQHCVHLESPHR